MVKFYWWGYIWWLVKVYYRCHKSELPLLGILLASSWVFFIFYYMDLYIFHFAGYKILCDFFHVMTSMLEIMSCSSMCGNSNLVSYNVCIICNCCDWLRLVCLTISLEMSSVVIFIFSLFLFSSYCLAERWHILSILFYMLDFIILYLVYSFFVSLLWLHIVDYFFASAHFLFVDSMLLLLMRC